MILLKRIKLQSSKTLLILFGMNISFCKNTINLFIFNNNFNFKLISHLENDSSELLFEVYDKTKKSQDEKG